MDQDQTMCGEIVSINCLIKEEIDLRKTLSTFLIFFFLVGFATPLHAMDAGLPEEVLSAAKEGLPQFKSMIGKEPSLYGYSDSEELNRIELGEGFRIYYIDSEKLMNDPNSQNLLSLVYPSDAWEFIVTLDGKPKSYLTVAPEDGKYKVVSLGGDATDFGIALENFRRFASEKGGGEPILVKVGPLYYLTAKIEAAEFVIPNVGPEKAYVADGMDNTRLWEASKVIASLKELQKTPPRMKSGVGNTSLTKDTFLPAGDGSSGIALPLTAAGVLVGMIVAFYLHIRHRRKNNL